MKLSHRIIDWACRRDPDFVIGGNDDPYLLRWWVIPRNPIFNVYVHWFLRSDDDRALHDHPWAFNFSWLLEGPYREWLSELTSVDRQTGDTKFRWGGAKHRIELFRPGSGRGELSCWTLFVTGPRVRQWGFHCPSGWVHWKDFTAAGDKGAVGKGCDQ